MMNPQMNSSKHMLSTNEMLILSSELNKREKSLALAYLMLLAGHLGVHRFYLKRAVSGVIQLVLFLIAIISYVIFTIMFSAESTMYSDPSYMDIGAWIVFLLSTLISGIALTIWVIVDACLLPGMVKKWNAELEQSLIDQIVSYRTQAPSQL